MISSDEKDNFILLPIHVLQICKIPIGDPILIKTDNNNTPFIKSAWPMSEKTMNFTVALSNEGIKFFTKLFLYWLIFKWVFYSIIFTLTQYWQIKNKVLVLGEKKKIIRRKTTYRRIWHAPSHRIRRTVSRRISSRKASTGCCYGRMNWFPVHHFIWRIHFFL